jgi:hypothetical protein
MFACEQMHMGQITVGVGITRDGLKMLLTETFRRAWIVRLQRLLNAC